LSVTRADILRTVIFTAIILIAIFTVANIDDSSNQAFSKIITVGPVWNTNSWICSSNEDFMVFGTLRGLGDSQISINISGKGTQSLYSLAPGQLETFSIGGEANDQVIVTRTGTVTGFLTLQTSSDAIADCKTEEFREIELLEDSGLFRVFYYMKDQETRNKQKVAGVKQIELKPEMEEYKDLVLDSSQKTAVIDPVFTLSAYIEPGFYTYFRGECDSSCLTQKIKFMKEEDYTKDDASSYPFSYASSNAAIQTLKLLGYDVITDYEVAKNPEIISNYDKIIVLHSEYVTKPMFDAITTHPKVIYLYPNALFAEVDVDFDKNSFTLIRGHYYPEPEIKNGFDWEYENTHPYEYDNTCLDWSFYEIPNGIMLDCYPEKVIFSDKELLKAIKEF